MVVVSRTWPVVISFHCTELTSDKGNDGDKQINKVIYIYPSIAIKSGFKNLKNAITIKMQETLFF